MECIIALSFLSVIFRSLIHMPISEGQITNKVEIIFAGETCRLLGKHEEKSKESQEHCSTALFCNRGFHWKFPDQLPTCCTLVSQSKKQYIKRRIKKRSWSWKNKEVGLGGSAGEYDQNTL